MDLTRFLSMPENVLPEASLYYIKVYDKFCETVIVPQILQDKKLLLLKSLTESFVKIIKEVEGVESSYRSSNLKNRLSKTFPQLQFTYDARMGYIVYSVAISASELVEDHVEPMSAGTDSDENNLSEPSTSQPSASQPTYPSNQENVRTMFFSSQIVKNAIHDSVAKFQSPWPPTATNLNIGCARQLVPHELFNWMLGQLD